MPIKMPLFSLPLYTSSTRPSTRVHFYPSISRKRKRLTSLHDDSGHEDILPPSALLTEQAVLPAASTNPLSLTPDEIHQYRTAGLDLDQELPSKSIPDFPHRGLPLSFPSDLYLDVASQANSSAPEVDDDKLRRESRAPNLRMQHFSVLTSILQRCLLEGDIPHAQRAWAMLLHAQHNGKGVDIRSSGYWGIGAELLIRDGEKSARDHTGFGRDGSVLSESCRGGSGNSEEDGELGETRINQSMGLRRWGTASGLDKAKDYYERLILQHPYTRQYHDSVSALDFWPAMLSCEIYGIQFEQKEALKRVVDEDQNDDINAADGFSSQEDDHLVPDDPDTYFITQQRKYARQGARKQDIVWKNRDKTRQTALLASEKVAARMDNLMSKPPYSDSQVLQKLCGMLALYIGDLSVPDPFETDSDQDYDDDDDNDRDQNGEEDSPAAYGWRSKQRALRRHRRAEYERGLVKREEARARARKAFERVRREGGRVDVDVVRVMRADS